MNVESDYIIEDVTLTVGRKFSISRMFSATPVEPPRPSPPAYDAPDVEPPPPAPAAEPRWIESAVPRRTSEHEQTHQHEQSAAVHYGPHRDPNPACDEAVAVSSFGRRHSPLNLYYESIV